MPARTNSGKNAAYRTNPENHSKPHVNWFIFGSWSVVLIIGLAFWAGVISLFM